MSHTTNPSSEPASVDTTRTPAGTDIPVDVAAWIDAHDPPEIGALDGVAPSDALAEQRAQHEPDRESVTEVNPALGRIVNNTGDDGGAATG